MQGLPGNLQKFKEKCEERKLRMQEAVVPVQTGLPSISKEVNPKTAIAEKRLFYISPSEQMAAKLPHLIQQSGLLQFPDDIQSKLDLNYISFISSGSSSNYEFQVVFNQIPFIVTYEENVPDGGIVGSAMDTLELEKHVLFLIISKQVKEVASPKQTTHNRSSSQHPPPIPGLLTSQKAEFNFFYQVEAGDQNYGQREDQINSLKLYKDDLNRFLRQQYQFFLKDPNLQFHSFYLPSQQHQYLIIFNEKPSGDGYVGVQFNQDDETSRLVCKRAQTGKSKNIQKLKKPQAFPLLTKKEEIKTPFQFYYEVSSNDSNFGQREDNVNDLKKFDEADITLLEQQYQQFISSTQPTLAFLLKVNQQVYKITFNAKLKTDGFIGVQKNQQTGSERLVCRKQRQPPGATVQKLVKPVVQKAQLKPSLQPVKAPQQLNASFYFKVNSADSNYNQREDTINDVKLYAPGDIQFINQEYNKFLTDSQALTYEFQLNVKGQTYSIKFDQRQTNQGFVGVQTSHKTSYQRKIYMRPTYQAPQPAIQGVPSGSEQIFYYKVDPSDSNYGQREDQINDLKLYDSNFGLYFRREYLKFMNSKNLTHEVKINVSSCKYKVIFDTKLRKDGRVGEQQNEDTHRKRDVMIKYQKQAPRLATNQVQPQPSSQAPKVPISPINIQIPLKMSPSDQVKLRSQLNSSDQKYKQVKQAFEATMKQATILKIEQVNHKSKTTVFKFHHQQTIQQGYPNNIKLLFHGSRNKNSSFLINAEEGLDPQYCDKGMWGKAVYFAAKASYSDGYAFTNPDGTFEMLYCQVNLGKEFVSQPDGNLRNPPPGFTSVRGSTQKTDVFMVYKNFYILIDCIITYKR